MEPFLDIRQVMTIFSTVMYLSLENDHPILLLCHAMSCSHGAPPGGIFYLYNYCVVSAPSSTKLDCMQRSDCSVP